MPDECQACGNRLPKGKCFIKPEFGFQTDAEEPRRPSDSRPVKTYSTGINFVDDDRQGTETTLQMPGGHVNVEMLHRGRLAVLNTSHFKLCYTCGYALPVTDAPKKATQPHAPPWSNGKKSKKNCQGTLYFVDLGHEFETDVVKLVVSESGATMHGRGDWLSLLYALLEGASSALNIQREDLDGCLFPRGRLLPPALVLFDNVPGGAGHVRRLAESMCDVLKKALATVAGDCGCGGGEGGVGNTSCYGCLRTYQNQWCHDDLRRGPARDFLHRLLGPSASGGHGSSTPTIPPSISTASSDRAPKRWRLFGSRT